MHCTDFLIFDELPFQTLLFSFSPPLYPSKENSVIIEDSLKLKEGELKESREANEDLEGQLAEKSAMVDRALREADQLDAQLEAVSRTRELVR